MIDTMNKEYLQTSRKQFIQDFLNETLKKNSGLDLDIKTF